MKYFLFLLFLICVSEGVLAEEPFITMTTSKSVGSSIEFRFVAKSRGTVIRVDFGDGILIEKTINGGTTEVKGTLVGSQNITIRGVGIKSINCMNCQLTLLDVSKYPLLEEINCGNNQLSNLGISKNAELKTLYCYNNPLMELDVKNNINLKNLYCYRNQLTSIDISQNKKLTHLVCDDNQLKELNVSNNMNLIVLYCSHNLLSTLDISNNLLLTQLSCSGNQLMALNVSNNSELINIGCAFNKLTSLDLLKNVKCETLFCHDNELDFSSLKLPLNESEHLYYSPQCPIEIPAKNRTGESIDLNNQSFVNDTRTIFNWKTINGIELQEGVDFEIKNGITKFYLAQPEGVYCEMTNSELPKFEGPLALKTKRVLLN